MAKFCTQCGTPTHPDFGLCPKCEAQKIAEMTKYPKFCSECGGRVEQINGNCTQCGKTYTSVNTQPAAEPLTIIADAPVMDTPIIQEVVADEIVSANENGMTEELPSEQFVTEVLTDQTAVESVVSVQSAPVQDPVLVTVPPAKQTQAQQSVIKGNKKEKTKKKASAGTVIITVLLSVLLFVFTLVGVGLFSIRQFVKEDTIEQMVENVGLSDILGMIGKEYKDSFYDTLGEFLKEETGEEISPKNLEKLVNGATIKRFISGKLYDYVNDFLFDRDQFDLSDKDMRKLLKQNAKTIEKELDIEISDEALNAVADWIINEEKIQNFRPAALKNIQPLAYYAINIGLSWITLILVAIMILLCIVTMLRNSPSQAVIGIGVVFIILGCLTSIAAVVALWVPSLIGRYLGGDLIATVIQFFFNSNILVFVAVLAVGILVLLARKITLVVISKHQKV